MEITPEIQKRLELLRDKYAAIGQDLNSYLDGLIFANPIVYWDYIEVDALLSLQKPKTDFPDEKIFIVYHQITELYFNLIDKSIIMKYFHITKIKKFINNKIKMSDPFYKR